ncbi:tellurium resistance protein TerC, partial [Pseudomonas sp. GP01-A3]
VHILSHDFVEGPIWNTIFWSVMLLIALGGWFLSKENTNQTNEEK